MFRVRCSSLPQIAACSASAHPPALRIVPASGEPARLGNAVHESQVVYINQGPGYENAVILGALGQKHRVDIDELGYLARAGRRAWDTIRHYFPEPRCEEEFTWVDETAQIVLAGHPDVYSANLDTLVVADWKSGFLWSDAEPQLRGYAWGLAQQFPVRKVTAFHVNIRRGEIERFDWTYEELAAWWQGMAGRIADGREIYSESYEACRHCPRFHECPAGTELARESIATINNNEIALEDDAVVNAYQRAKFVEKVVGEVLDRVRAMVFNAGGSVTSSDGRELAFERQKREKIDAEAAYRSGLALDKFLAASSLSKTKLLDAIRKESPRGCKGADADAAMTHLRAAGAVTETFIEKLELRKAPKALPQPKEEPVTV